MEKNFISRQTLFCVLILAIASTSYADVVIGNWENGLDGAFPWDPTYPAQLLTGQTYGVTLGSESLGVVISNNTTYWNLGVNPSPHPAGGTINVSIDVTFNPNEWAPGTDGGQWAQLDKIYWMDDVSWSWNESMNLTVTNRDTGFTVGKAWGGLASDARRTYTWKGLSVPAGTSFGEIGFAMQQGDWQQTGVFYLDNLRITTPATAIISGWGSNDEGQVTPPAGNNFIAIAAGLYHSLALTADGSIVGWGSNFDGVGNWAGQATPPAPPAGKTFIAISAGAYHSLALDSGGSIHAWGSNTYGQCDVPSLNTGFVAIAAGYIYSLALKYDGTIVAWGNNTYGQLPPTDAGSNFIAIAAGRTHSIALTSDGIIAGWGLNDFYQLPGKGAGNNNIAIAAGDDFTLALKSNGKIGAWGLDSFGQVSNAPTGSNFIAIAAGGYHCLALTSDGTIVAWGDNINGETGNAPGENNFIAVAAGYWHSLALQNFINVNYTINTGTNKKPISPYIYGTNTGYPTITNPGGDSNYTIARYGGNRLTAYNWENNWSNAGGDYWWLNDLYLTNYQIEEPGKPVTDFRDKCIASKQDSIVTLQMAGYVSDALSGMVDCNIYAAPSKYFKQVVFAKGAPFCSPPGSPDTMDASVYMDEFVNFLVSKYGHAGQQNGVKFYDLDNEPDLWYDTDTNPPYVFPHHGTHWEVHPTGKVTCAELIGKTIALATAVKNVDPNAQLLGPVSYGFRGFLTFQDAPDWPSYQNNYDWFLSYYLDQMKANSVTAGKRLLDVLDLHWYPDALDSEGNRIVWGPKPPYSRANADARMQAPRSLWDSDYKENSRIEQLYSKWLPILPPIQKSIDTYYPDTNLAFTEYAYGGETHYSGGIATADVLGIFGKYGVYIATYFYDGNYVDAAIKMYTNYANYDDKPSKFGDTEVDSTVSDKVDSSIYASVFSSGNDSSLHLIVINKNLDKPISGTFNITSTQNFITGKVWKFDSKDPNIKETTPIKVITGNSFTYTIPNLTVCHIVLGDATWEFGIIDFNHDLLINFPDLYNFLNSWPVSCNFNDFALFAQLWGW